MCGSWSWARWPWWVVAGTAVIAGAVGLILWLTAGSPPAPPARARQYLNSTACLLTDARGPSGPTAAPVWAAMEDASTASRVRVQYRTTSGATADEAAASLTSMALARCGVIFVADTAATAMADKVAQQFPGTRFYVLGGAHSGRNVVALTGSPEQVAAQVRKTVADAARGQGSAPTG